MVDNPDGSWVVKRRQYTGGESIVAIKTSKEEAQARADEYNLQYQTDNYFIEEYSTEKAAEWPSVDVAKKFAKKFLQKIIDKDKS